MATYIGLYHPFIHFRDDGWVKLASLYWDRMARIVPPGYPTTDSEVVQRFKESGFVKDFPPDPTVSSGSATSSLVWSSSTGTRYEPTSRRIPRMRSRAAEGLLSRRARRNRTRGWVTCLRRRSSQPILPGRSSSGFSLSHTLT